jgi:ATP-dependent DNA ligase
MSEGLPATLRPPVALALAKAVESIPRADALPGGCLYEPKWDGFRVCMVVGTDGISLWSRQGKDLTRYFPDLVAAAAQQLPPGVVLDGEALIWSDDRLDFNSLQQRMITSKKDLPAFMRERPASYAAFDLLAVAGHDIRAVPLADRRALLEELADNWAAPLNLSPATKDRKLATTWFEEMTAAGIEGLVIKAAGQTYEGGQRQWLKVKHRDVLDVVCAAVIGPRTHPAAIIAGLPIGGRLRIVGRSTPLSAKAARDLGRFLRSPAREEHPWPEEVSPVLLDRFSKDKDPVRLTLVEPVTVEVSADVAWSGRSFRHPVRYLRPRPDLPPADVGLPEALER